MDSFHLFISHMSPNCENAKHRHRRRRRRRRRNIRGGDPTSERRLYYISGMTITVVCVCMCVYTHLRTDGVFEIFEHPILVARYRHVLVEFLGRTSPQRHRITVARRLRGVPLTLPRQSHVLFVRRREPQPFRVVRPLRRVRRVAFRYLAPVRKTFVYVCGPSVFDFGTLARTRHPSENPSMIPC